MNYYDNINNIFLQFINDNYNEKLYEQAIRKSNNSLKISDSLFLTKEEKNIVYLIIMLSTIKEFTKESSISILFDQKNIRFFIKDTKYDDIIKEILYLNENNKELINSNVTTKLFFNILKDVNILDELYYLINSNFNLTNKLISGHVINNFSNNKLCENPITELDNIIFKMSKIYILNFKYSFYFIKEEKYIDKIISNLKLNDQILINLFDQLKKITDKYITLKIGEAYHGW